MKRRILGFVCAAALLFALPVNAGAASSKKLDSAIAQTARYCLSTVPSPGEGAQWIVLGLTRGELDLPDGYLSSYYAAMKRLVSSGKGVLSGSKYTEYSNAVLGITAAGYDASNVAGYDLTAPLSDYDSVKRQGINGPVFALLALDSGNYLSTMRDEYVDYILSRQLEDGGWAVSGTVSDTDVTAMALQALAKYTYRADVAAAVDGGLTRLSKLQKADGGYASYGKVNSESTAQVILALCELGISLEDARFVKGGKTLVDVLLSYQNKDGSFCHTQGDGGSGIATEQALLAMVSAGRQGKGLRGVYTIKETARFTDVSGHWAEEGIRFCVSSGLFQGTSDTKFSPEQSMNRAMLVTVLWRLAGEPKVTGKNTFSDVAAGAYYADAIRWASKNGIAEGYSDGTFGVGDSVTRQQLALFLYRYARYMGYDVSGAASLSGFSDAGEVASWAKAAMGWAAGEGVITGSTGGKLLPGGKATRAQVAVILMRFVEEMT